MSMFNKAGDEFKFLVNVDPQPGTDPEFYYRFPTRAANGQVIERWARKVRPIKHLTGALHGCQLRHKRDYMVDYNSRTDKYEYWFMDQADAVMFALMCGSMKQGHSRGSGPFDIECPHCGNAIAQHQVKWR